MKQWKRKLTTEIPSRHIVKYTYRKRERVPVKAEQDQFVHLDGKPQSARARRSPVCSTLLTQLVDRHREESHYRSVQFAFPVACALRLYYYYPLLLVSLVYECGIFFSRKVEKGLFWQQTITFSIIHFFLGRHLLNHSLTSFIHLIHSVSPLQAPSTSSSLFLLLLSICLSLFLHLYQSDAHLAIRRAHISIVFSAHQAPSHRLFSCLFFSLYSQVYNFC